MLVHYDALLADLDGQMRRLAALLGIEVPGDSWPTLVEAASFASMKKNAGATAPDGGGVLKDVGAFFRQGRSGGWAALMTDDQVAHYERRVAGLAPPDVVEWLHDGAGRDLR